MFFQHMKTHPFFSILTLYLGEKQIAKTNFILLCSPFNSASNHILDIVLKCASSKIITLEYRPLTRYFTYIELALILYACIFYSQHCIFTFEGDTS